MKVLGFDFETHLIGEPDIIPKPVCVSYYKPEIKDKGLIIGMKNMEEYLFKILSDKGTLKIAHNATFEILVIYKYFPNLRSLLWENIDEGLIFCTQLQQKLIDNVSKKGLKSHSLAFLVNHYFDIDLSDVKNNPDAWRLRYRELDGLPVEDWPKEAIDYAINDSVYTVDLYNKQQALNSNLEQKEHVKASVTLNLIASRGILISKDRVETLEREIDVALEPIEAVLIDNEILCWNKNKTVRKKRVPGYSMKTKKVQQHITDNIKNLYYTKTGGISTEKESLQSYAAEKPDDIIIQALYERTLYIKTKTAFISRLKTADPYMHTQYKAIMESGRSSSSASPFYPSVNIQQQPRGIK